MNRLLVPGDRHYAPNVARMRADRAYAAAVATWSQTDENHPAIRAAIGRVLFHQGAVPQLDAETPEAIAWRRASGADPGAMNRSARRRRS